jgi:hypothetical protein
VNYVNDVGWKGGEEGRGKGRGEWSGSGRGAREEVNEGQQAETASLLFLSLLFSFNYL